MYEGPDYPELGSAVAKWRRIARVRELTFLEREEYGAAICAAIRAKQKAELQRELPTIKPSCASGTAHTRGADILRAVAAQHRSALIASAARERKARPAHVWREMYEQATTEKARANG